MAAANTARRHTNVWKIVRPSGTLYCISYGYRSSGTFLLCGLLCCSYEVVLTFELLKLKLQSIYNDHPIQMKPLSDTFLWRCCLLYCSRQESLVFLVCGSKTLVWSLKWKLYASLCLGGVVYYVVQGGSSFLVYGSKTPKSGHSNDRQPGPQGLCFWRSKMAAALRGPGDELEWKVLSSTFLWCYLLCRQDVSNFRVCGCCLFLDIFVFLSWELLGGKGFDKMGEGVHLH